MREAHARHEKIKGDTVGTANGQPSLPHILSQILRLQMSGDGRSQLVYVLNTVLGS